MGTAPPVSEMSDSNDFRQRLLASPMSPFQIQSVVIILILCALDGFDVFAITFAAPGIATELGIGRGALGLVFAAGLVAMAFGSLILAPVADIYGRKRIVIVSLLLMALGTFGTSVGRTLSEIATSRVITGFGIGAMIAVLNPLAAEYANARRRDIVVTLLNLGFPFGGLVGGAAAAHLIPAFGWRSIFDCASVLALIMLAVTLLLLPEPVPGILARSDRGTLGRLNGYLKRARQPALESLPQKATAAKRRSFAVVLGRDEIGNTFRVTAVYFLFVMSVFYIQSWIPTLVVGSGYTASQAALVSTVMNLSGVIGGFALALLVPKLGLKPVVIFAFLLNAVAIVLFGWIAPSLTALSLVAILVGTATIGGMANFYAVVSRSFPSTARASGSGFVIGIGRFGSALGPALGGWLFAAGFTGTEVALAMALPAVLAAILLFSSRLHNFD